MKKIRKILLWVFGILLVLAIQGVILIFLYEKEIKSAALDKLNQQLNSPIEVGKIELSYFKHFPYISLRFPDVTIYESNNNHKGILLQASEISLFFNIWDIYQGKYDVKKLYINHASWNSKIDQFGNNNFEIVKSDTNTSTQNSKFKLSIEEIIILNSSVLHIDLASKFIYRSDIASLKAKGAFSANEFELTLISQMHVKTLNYEQVNYIKNKEINLNTSIAVDFTNDHYQFNSAAIKIEKLNLLLDGDINFSSSNKSINLTAQGKELDIQSFLSILPNQYSNKVKEYKSTGTMFLQTSIKGSLDSNKTPRILLLAGFENTEVEINNSSIKNQKINRLNFKLSYDNNATVSMLDDRIDVNSFTATFQDKPIQGHINISELNDPYIDLYIETQQSLTDIQKIFPIKDVDFKKGDLALKLKLQTHVSDLEKNNNIKHIESEGNVKITNASLLAGKYALALENINGDYSFQKADLRINSMSLKIGTSDIILQGFFRNLFSFLLSENEDLSIDAALTSNKLNLKELLSSGENSTETEPYRLKINPRLNVNLKLNVKEIQFLPFQALDVQGEMSIENQNISTNYLACRSQKGLVFAKINFNAKQPKRMPMDIDLILNKVDVSNLFREFDNFGVDIITDKNIRGNLSTSMKINILWDENLNSIHEAFYAKGNVLIENGELLNFDPMLALGKYIDVNDLKNLKFSNLENTIEIKNKIIYIPSMEIKSNALSLQLSGTHSFENKIDYHLQLLLSDFIKKKSKTLGDERFGEIEPDGTGNTKLLIRMYGDAENPQFSLDKKEIRKKLVDDFKNERAEMKKVLKDEFNSLFKKEKDFKESINEGASDWEKDIPQQNNSNKIVPSTSKTDSVNKKSKTSLQKLKDKLKEKPEVDE
jgi:hypothetical protein